LENHLIDFGKDHEVVAPDMRGYNLSSKPTEPEPYQIKDMIEELRALPVGEEVTVAIQKKPKIDKFQ